MLQLRQHFRLDYFAAIYNPDYAVTINAHLTKTGLELGGTATGLSPDDLALLKRNIPNVGDNPDLAAFADFLLDVKQKYPKSDTIILLPDPGVPYDQLIKVMDAAREKPLDIGGKLRVAKLFPTVVVSTVIK